jgi:hypothetical protein
MKIALCGSLNCAEEILKIKEKLIEKGHEVMLPASLENFSLKNSDDAKRFKSKDYYLEIKPKYMKDHFNKIVSSDAILVVNGEKNGIKNYIGGATFGEIMIAFHYNKKIFLLNPIPADEKLVFIREEIEASKPTILNENLDLIK